MNFKKLSVGFACLSVLCCTFNAWAWSEEQVDSVAAGLSPIGNHAHSTFHYELTKLIAYEAGFPIGDAEFIVRYCALVDMINPQANYPNPGALNPISIPDTIPEWPQSLAGTERGSNARNSFNETPGVYWHFPFRNPADSICGALVYGASYPVVPPPDEAHTQNPYFWRLTQTVPPEYLSAMKRWAIFGEGAPGLPTADAADTVMYFDAAQQQYLPVPPGGLIALAVFVHCLADCYSHEECMVQDTIRSHPAASECGGNYHYMELPYYMSSYAYPHCDRAAQAVWRAFRACINAHNLGYTARWNEDSNGFEDNDGVPDELEDNGNLDHNETFMERWKSPALRDLNGDGELNHFDHTLHRIQLVMDILNGEAANELEPLLPRALALGQNYPNPFNATCVIPYEVPSDGHVSLSVFDILGRHTATLVNDVQSAGAHRMTWNGITDSGESAASGVYVYHLQTGRNTAARKMLLIR
jgi:hypothetical protein